MRALIALHAQRHAVYEHDVSAPLSALGHKTTFPLKSGTSKRLFLLGEFLDTDSVAQRTIHDGGNLCPVTVTAIGALMTNR